MQKRRVKQIVIIVALLIAAIVAYQLWKRFGGGAGAQGDSVAVVTYTVMPKALLQDIKAVGTLQADEAADMRAEVSGKVISVYFKEGQPVGTGQLLLEIDDRILHQEMERTKAAFDLARLTYGRRSELRKSGSMSVQSKDEAEAELRSSAAAYEDAKIRWEKSHIMAPFDGIVGLRSVSIGDFLEVGDSITHLVRIDPMKVEFFIPEKYFASLKPGQPVYVTVDAWPGKEFQGELYAIDPSIDPDTRNIVARAELSNPDMQLRPGMFAYMRLRVNAKENALLVPEETLIPKGKEFSVMKVVDGKAQPANVKIGVRQKAMVEVVEGLQPGDVVITAGHMKVQPGKPVQSVPGPQSAADETLTPIQEQKPNVEAPASTVVPARESDPSQAPASDAGANAAPGLAPAETQSPDFAAPPPLPVPPASSEQNAPSSKASERAPESKE